MGLNIHISRYSSRIILQNYASYHLWIPSELSSVEPSLLWWIDIQRPGSRSSCDAKDYWKQSHSSHLYPPLLGGESGHLEGKTIILRYWLRYIKTLYYPFVLDIATIHRSHGVQILRPSHAMSGGILTDWRNIRYPSLIYLH